MNLHGRPPELTLSINNLGDFELAASAIAEAGLGERLPLIEILWDNYCALDPEKLAAYLFRFSDNVSLHIMWSRFLEVDDDTLDAYLRRLRAHVAVLRPCAVSDHLCRFSSGPLHLVFGQELGYDRLDHACARVDRYQRAIGMPLLVENAASIEYPAEIQREFIDRLVARTGCGILFDVSNAVVGELNRQGAVEPWIEFLRGRELRCHVGSYALEEKTGLVQDTHSTAVTPETERALRLLTQATRVHSICYERDYNKTASAIAADLVRIRACCVP